MRRFLRLEGSWSGRRRRVALVLGVVAVASTTLMVSSGSSVGAKESSGADLNAARAPAVANTPSRSASPEAASSRKREDTPHTTRPDAPLGHDRTADNSHVTALFAAHSWYVAPPPPPPAPPPPPVAPTAPPFPYTFVGAYASQGAGTVYFLAQGDRVVDAHVGDRLDGVYQFESATAGQLTFNYLPLNIRQLLPTGAPQ